LINGLRKLDIHMQKKKLDAYLIPYAKINSKWIKGLNVRAKMVKLLEAIIGVNFHNFELGSGFLHKLNIVKIKKFCNTKNTINNVKGRSTWVTQLVKRPTPDSSSLDLRVISSSPVLGSMPSFQKQKTNKQTNKQKAT